MPSGQPDVGFRYQVTGLNLLAVTGLDWCSRRRDAPRADTPRQPRSARNPPGSEIWLDRTVCR
jgi:hypothetical protein